MQNYQIDNLDRSILHALMDNARIPYAELAKNLAVSAGTIHVRVEKMKQAGIIDPFKVTKQALLNAASISGTILLTEVAIVDVPEEKQSHPQMDPSMMGMM